MSRLSIVITLRSGLGFVSASCLICLVGWGQNALASTDFNELAHRNHKLALAENLYLNCHYPALAGFRLEEQLGALGRPTEDICRFSDHLLSGELDLARSRGQVLDGKFPPYEELLKRSFELRTRNIGLVPFHSSDKRSQVRGANIDPWVIEREVRVSLGVDESLVSDLSATPDCSEGEPEDIRDLRVRPYDSILWRRVLYQRGYECAVARYNALSSALNHSRFFQSQSVFDQALRDQTQGLDPQGVRGKVFVYFPNLSYDLPSLGGQREKLTPYEMKSAFETAGAAFVIVHRVSVEPLSQQVEDSAKSMRAGLEQLPFEFRDQQVIVLGRSMGSAVARLVLENHSDLKARTRMVISVGGTPFGSVIADYKGRADVFDEMRANPNISPQGLMFWLRANIFSSIFNQDARIWRAVQSRNSIFSMSHVHFNPANSRQTDLPVLNVIFAPERIRSYFGGSRRTPSVDLVFYHMSLYGPTEGSAPLSHAAWDTRISGRVLYTRMNHLTFWELDDDQSLALWSAAIKAAGN